MRTGRLPTRLGLKMYERRILEIIAHFFVELVINPSLTPFSDSLIKLTSRRIRVSSFFALITYQLAVR